MLSTFVPTLHGVTDNKDKPDPGLTWKDFQLLLLVGDLKTDNDIKTKTYTTRTTCNSSSSPLLSRAAAPLSSLPPGQYELVDNGPI